MTFLLAFAVLFSKSAVAQDDTVQTAELVDPIEFTVKTIPDTATVGDEIEVTIEVSYPDSIDLTKPSVKANEDVVIKGEPEIKSRTSRGRKIDTYKYKLAAFAVDEVELPYFEFYYYDSEGNQNSRIAPIETVFIRSVLPEQAVTDTIQQPLDNRDIVPPKSLPIIWWPYAVGAGVLIILVLAYWYFFKYRQKLIEAPEAPPEPPFDVAIRRLHDLERQDLPSKGRFKQFYIELTEILRHYIDGRFEIPAAESTTYELKRILKHPEIRGDYTKAIIEMLTRADLVKFAKQEPRTEEPLNDFAMTKKFIVDTKPREIIEEEKEQAKQEVRS